MNFNFKNLPVTTVPDQWIYQYYLDLKTPLDGSRIRIKSIFNNEMTPSMFLYTRDNKYVWKDHSSGFGGSAVDLVQRILQYRLNRVVGLKETIGYLEDNYKVWKELRNKGNEFESIALQKEYYAYELKCDYDVRPFEEHDLQYWGGFGVSRYLLEQFNVAPLSKFLLGRLYTSDERVSKAKWYKPVQEYYSYGFFNNAGDLLKIYNPYRDDLKHVSLTKALLGREQLCNIHDTLVIGASMKDILSLESLNLDIETVAPMSEKTIISAEDITDLKNIYKNVITLFDNDKTGVRAMMMYKALYDIDFAYIPYCKDIAEFRESYEPEEVKSIVAMAINKKINKADAKDAQKASRFEGYQA